MKWCDIPEKPSRHVANQDSQGASEAINIEGSNGHIGPSPGNPKVELNDSCERCQSKLKNQPKHEEFHAHPVSENPQATPGNLYDDPFGNPIHPRITVIRHPPWWVAKTRKWRTDKRIKVERTKTNQITNDGEEKFHLLTILKQGSSMPEPGHQRSRTWARTDSFHPNSRQPPKLGEPKRESIHWDTHTKPSRKSSTRDKPATTPHQRG